MILRKAYLEVSFRPALLSLVKKEDQGVWGIGSSRFQTPER